MLLLLTTVLQSVAANGKGKNQSSTNLGTYHAILIGINNYESFNKLKTPEKDVQALATILKGDYGFEEVTLLTDKTSDKPTATNILRVIREKAQRLTDNDNLLIYYAGHGQQDELTAAGYWIPINGKVDDPSSWISHDQIKSLLETNKIKVKNFLLIADSCYSGQMTRSIEIQKGLKDEGGIQKLLERGAKKSREVITSGGNEPVEDGVIGSDHSLFAHYLIKALKDNQNRYIDAGTLLYESVRPEVVKRGKQVPERSRVNSAVDENGVFVMTKIGIAERVKKPDFSEEVARLNKENETLKSELVRQKEKQKDYENKLVELNSKQSQLLSDKSKLDEIDKKNKDDELRLKAVLKEKDKMSLDKLAELDKEKSRIENLNKQILQDRNGLKSKEKLLADAESQLQKTKSELAVKTEEQKQSLALLEQKKKEIAEKEKFLNQKLKEEEERAKVAELKRKEFEKNVAAAEIKKKQIDENVAVAEKKKKLIDENVAVAEKKKKQIDENVAAATDTQKKIEQQILAAEETKKRLDKDAQVVAGVIADYKNEGDAKGRFVVFGNIVFDKETNLMWLKDANYANVGKDYEDAEKYVNGLSVAGYGEWHIPTIDEWRSLIPKDVKGVEKAFPEGHPFSNVVLVGNYWAASTITGSQGINLGNGSLMRWSKNKTGYLWPVRYATPDEVLKLRKAAVNKGK
jgi:uncharacterized caspase-like protein